MKEDYPHFQTSYSHDELVEHFLLTPTEQSLIAQCRGDVNRHGVAVLLTSLRYLGYFPGSLQELPTDVKTFLARQLNLLWEPSAQYPTDERTQRYHLALIRQHTGWRAPTTDDKATLEYRLRHASAYDAPTEEDLLECAYQRLRALQIELPAERELRRVVHTALHGFLHDIYTRVTARLPEAVRTTFDQLLVVGSNESVSKLEQLKIPPAAPTIAASPAGNRQLAAALSVKVSALTPNEAAPDLVKRSGSGPSVRVAVF